MGRWSTRHSLITLVVMALVGSVVVGGVALVGPAAASPTSAQKAPVAAADDLTRWVNPFVGTQNFGNTFPGAAAPFGMVQVSPDTGGQGGYDYQQDRIYGFSQTHLSGVGCGVVGELPVMPTTGAVTTVDHRQYGSPYRHDDEEATPGHYRVGLSKYGIDAELTATDRTGWQHYTFPAGKQANVLFNTGKANMTVFDSEIRVVGDHTLEGRITDGNFCAGQDRHTVYFTAEFNTPFATSGTWSGSKITPGSTESATENGANGAYITFPAGTEQATLKVGLSYTGVAGARKNLEAETQNSFDFGATRAALTARWNTELQAARVTGGTDERRTAYYTSLYHSLLHPNLAGDVDGRYLGWDGEQHIATDYTPRQNFSLWDTYRPQNQLLELLAPDVARDSYLSILAIGREGGWLPRWALVNSETNIMTGDPVTPFLVEGWSKGFLAGHEQEAYALLKRSATERPPADSQYNGRSGQHYYAELGYVPYGLQMKSPDEATAADCITHGGDNDCNHPASATLEYSAADAALSLMAKGLGHRADASMFAERGGWYRTLWDAQTASFRPRLADGTWLTPYDPVEASMAFHEGGSFQYEWLAPQDPAGLIALMGGRAKAADRLDEFFAYDAVLADPAAAAREQWISAPYDYYAKHTYNPNNEPDLLAPFMYAYVQQPAKTATVTRAAFGLFTTGPDGMTGNDDLGTMSAWYVFASWGMYPTMSGGNFFVLSSPQFETVDVRIAAPETVKTGQGGTLHITAPGVTDARRYVDTVRVDGAATSRSWIDWSAVRSGGRLDFTVGATPSRWGTGAADVPPSVVPAGRDDRRSLAAGLTPAGTVVPTSATSTRLTLSMLAQAPGNITVDARVTVSRGWTATPRLATTVLRSASVPASRNIPLTLTLPSSVKPGKYPVTVTVRSAGLKTVKRTVVVEIREPAICGSTTGGACALDLGGAFTRDGTATVAASDQGDFDGAGWSFDADLLPAAGPTTVGGVTYDLPSSAGTAKNFVTATGQTLLVPAGKYRGLRLLGAAHGGDVSTALTVTYADGSTGSVPVTVTDWAAGEPRGGNTRAFPMPHRIKAGTGVDGPPVSIFGASVALDPGKAVVSIGLPDRPGLEIMAITAIRGS